jgi:hypothetical protein
LGKGAAEVARGAAFHLDLGGELAQIGAFVARSRGLDGADAILEKLDRLGEGAAFVGFGRQQARLPRVIVGPGRRDGGDDERQAGGEPDPRSPRPARGGAGAVGALGFGRSAPRRRAPRLGLGSRRVRAARRRLREDARGLRLRSRSWRGPENVAHIVRYSALGINGPLTKRDADGQIWRLGFSGFAPTGDAVGRPAASRQWDDRASRRRGGVGADALDHRPHAVGALRRQMLLEAEFAERR